MRRGRAVGRKVFIVLLCAVVITCAVLAGRAIAQASYESERMEDRGPIPPEETRSAVPSRPGLSAAVSQGSSDVAAKLDNILAEIRELKAALSDMKKELNTVKIRVTQSQ